MKRPNIRQKLDSQEVELLRNRVAISREVGVFSLVDIVKYWDIGKTTLYRYDSDEYREKSRAIDKQTYQKQKASKVSDEIRNGGKVCATCEKPLEGHKRCPMCDRLIHKLSSGAWEHCCPTG